MTNQTSTNCLCVYSRYPLDVLSMSSRCPLAVLSISDHILYNFHDKPNSKKLFVRILSISSRCPLDILSMSSRYPLDIGSYLPHIFKIIIRITLSPSCEIDFNCDLRCSYRNILILYNFHDKPNIKKLFVRILSISYRYPLDMLSMSLDVLSISSRYRIIFSTYIQNNYKNYIVP